MTCGILTEPTSRKFFEKVNMRSYCESCYLDRTQFAHYDKKHNECYSNMLLGFSSEIVKLPVDLLVIAEAHGGGRAQNFRPQLDLDSEVTQFAEYYLNEPLQKFNQKEMRILFQALNDKGKTWIFTDLIKCFVWQGRDRENNLRGSDNRLIAIQHCRSYLDEQIEILQPKKVLCLGNTVAKNYFKLKKPEFKHGSVHKIHIKKHKFDLIFSIFPSRNTADLWVANKEWDVILPKLV